MPKHSAPRYQPPAEVETAISEIVSVQNRGWQPFIKVFRYEPENQGQQPLGTLFGVFSIEHYSPTSEYVVNFLVSTLKKAYYASAKRTPAEALEGALHRVNLGLSELARQDNTDWLGHLHAVVCAAERRELHFSATGNGKLFLLRRDYLTDISEGLVSEEAALHPLKTFTDISSGRLEADDCLVATTPGLLEVVTPLEMERVFRRLPSDRFQQFLKTVMENKVEFGGLVSVSVKEKPGKPEPRTAPRQRRKQAVVSDVGTPEKFNFFGKQLFEKASPKEEKRKAKEAESAEEAPLEVILRDTEERTRHIYVQGEEPLLSEKSERYERLLLLWEDLTDGTKRALRTARREIGIGLSATAATSGRLSRRALRQASLWSRGFGRRFGRSGRHALAQGLSFAEGLRERLKRRKPPSDRMPVVVDESFTLSDAENVDIAEPAPDIVHEPLPEPAPRAEASSSEVPAWILRRRQELQREKEAGAPPPETAPEKTRVAVRPAGAAVWKTLPFAWTKAVWGVLRAIGRSPLRLRERFPKRVRLILAVLALFGISGIAAFMFLGRQPEPAPAVPAPAPAPPVADTPRDPLVDEAGLVRIESAPVSRDTLPGFSLNRVDGTTVSVLADAVRVLPENGGEVKNFAIATGETGKAVMAVAMRDIRTLLILTDKGQVLSFTPSNGKFAANAFALPEGAKPAALGAYLTYLYVLDPETKQIYRYPRAEGGFGKETAWLKETVPLASSSQLLVDERLYLTDGAQIRAFAKGKTDPSVSFENPKNPLTVTDLVRNDDGTLSVLDKTQGRVLLYSPEGKIVKQYAHESLKQASAIAVSASTLWFATDAGVFSLSLSN